MEQTHTQSEQSNHEEVVDHSISKKNSKEEYYEEYEEVEDEREEQVVVLDNNEQQQQQQQLHQMHHQQQLHHNLQQPHHAQQQQQPPPVIMTTYADQQLPFYPHQPQPQQLDKLDGTTQLFSFGIGAPQQPPPHHLNPNAHQHLQHHAWNHTNSAVIQPLNACYPPPGMDQVLQHSPTNIVPQLPVPVQLPITSGSMNNMTNPGAPGVISQQPNTILITDPLEIILGVFPCVHLRNLPFEANVEDVLVFFQGLVILDALVCCYHNYNNNNYAGKIRGNGEGFVIFANPIDFQMALQRDRQIIGRRYIEVKQGKRMDYYAAIASQYYRRNNNYNGHTNDYNSNHHHDNTSNNFHSNKTNQTPSWNNSSNVPTAQSDNKEQQHPQQSNTYQDHAATSSSNAVNNNNNTNRKGEIQQQQQQYNNNNRQQQQQQQPYRDNNNHYHPNNYAPGYQNNHYQHRNNNINVNQSNTTNHNNINPNYSNNNNTNNAGGGGGTQLGEHTGYLRLRGLPYTATIQDVKNFFIDYEVSDESIAFTFKSDGRATGEAYLSFISPEESHKAIVALQRKVMGSRYIELFISFEEEHARALARFQNR